MSEAETLVVARRRFGPWFFILLSMLMVLAAWWVFGLLDGTSSGFGDTPVTLKVEDANLVDVIAVLRPGVPVRIEGSPNYVINIKVEDLREQDVFRFIALLAGQQIVMHDGIIIVRDLSWFERSYRWTARWSFTNLDIRLWPNR